MLCKQPTILLIHLSLGFDELLFASSFAMRSPLSFRSEENGNCSPMTRF